MSNLEKNQAGGSEGQEIEETNVVGMEISSEETHSDETSETEEVEAMMRELVLGLPALRRREYFGVDQDEDEDDDNPSAFPMAAVEEKEDEDKGEGEKEDEEEKDAEDKGEDEEEKESGSEEKNPSKKPKTDIAGSSGSGSGEAKPKKKAPELIDPPAGPPVCPHCSRVFKSWKAVFGHLRAHKDRQHHGFFPPPKFSAAADGIIIRDSGNAIVTSFDGNGGGDGSQGGARGHGIDLNALPGEASEEINVPMPKPFDLNKTPPKEDEEEEEEDEGKEDKA